MLLINVSKRGGAALGNFPAKAYLGFDLLIQDKRLKAGLKLVPVLSPTCPNVPLTDYLWIIQI